MKHQVVAVLIILLLAAGCGKRSITGAEREAVLGYANPASDRILAAYNDGTYARYVTDFDAQMKNAMPENVFVQTRELIMSKIGKYLSREVSDVSQKDQFVVVKYKGKFEREDGVEIKVVFQKIGDRDLVSGLWFNSPKLRQ
ncbi:MAG TPA: DUF3887 domain-containing protein [Spirochaetota bacterium]|nr:DUF3887 domain-containing protein [Spirochaetota bacterium]HNT10424.1 DUF3887 domain-containing protein [Spirochaetota bacterium]HNV47352.1 DUF3887 domain-containing protein [Spirochaetota bacterium]HOS38698.1 DUF3887 domain-containing protein [Spirochaetota bacterium]HPI23389.1 DUF3887 domain-containing protein [Spirochaetota bacterium]